MMKKALHVWNVRLGCISPIKVTCPVNNVKEGNIKTRKANSIAYHVCQGNTNPPGTNLAVSCVVEASIRMERGKQNAITLEMVTRESEATSLSLILDTWQRCLVQLANMLLITGVSPAQLTHMLLNLEA